MGDENPICTLGDYNRPSREGYQNNIELLDGNNVVLLRSDTIRLVQNGCSFHELRFEDPNQHLKDLLKLVNSLDLNVANRERTRLQNDGDIMFVEITKKYDDSSEEESEEDESVVTRELGVEYFDKFPTRSELTYHKYFMCALILSLFLRNPIIVGGCPSNHKIPCNIGHVHLEKAYIDLNSPINIMTCMQYNWIMRKQLEPKEDHEGIRGISNFTGRIEGMHIFVGNFTYVLDFMIVEDIRIVKFANGTDEIAYKMPYKIEQFNSLSDLEKEHTKSIYVRNEEDKRRGVDYVMNKILGFYKECLELGPEYLTGLE
ncbi:hypothetical protein Tco_0164212 [Tanacetum coccineum]